MAKPYTVNITDGVGTSRILNDTYGVTASVNGYTNLSIDPNSVVIDENTNTYNFTISAEGELTLHVTEDGTSTGTAVVGASFIRCDSAGTTYGTAITTDTDGNAIFSNVPFDTANAPTVYFKQTASDGEHEFDDSLLNVLVDTQAKTHEITNPQPVLKTLNLVDANYTGLPIETGSITLF